MKPRKATARPNQPRRPMLARFALALAGPLVFILLLEAILRISGYGYPTSFFLLDKTRGVYTSNPKFGWRFFPKAIARAPLPLAMPAIKTPGTYRIFILGESAAMGDPEPSFGFSRILQVMLEEQFPQRRFEVINLAMSAINSHVVRQIAIECAKHQPDLFIVYMGNNEVVGPYGPGTAFRSGVSHRLPVRASIWARSTRVGQALGDLMERADTNKTKPKFWKSMEMFSSYRIASDDPRMAIVHDNFGHNLSDILHAASSVGAQTLLCTMATNLKDCPPFASLHRAGMTFDESNRWDAAYSAGLTFENNNQHTEALTAFEKASVIDQSYAELPFRMGNVFTALDRYDDARTAFVNARDFDALHFRADSTINDSIRAVAGRFNPRAVQLVDVAAALQKSPLASHGAVGNALFYEHVHFTFDGNYALASALFSPLASMFSSLPTPPQPSSREHCADRLAYTPWDQYSIASLMAERMEAPPFSYQTGHTELLNAMRKFIRSQKSAVMATLDSAQQTYREAITRWPDDWHLRENCAKLAEARHDPAEAATQWRFLIEHEPDYPRAREGYGILLLGLGKFDEGVSQLKEALRLSPLDPFAYLNLGSALIASGKQRDGMSYYQQALDLCPDNSGIHYTVGATYMNQGELTEARSHFEEAVKLDPNNVQAHNNLGIVLFKQGDHEGAATHWRKALEIQPDFEDALYNLRNLRMGEHTR